MSSCLHIVARRASFDNIRAGPLLGFLPPLPFLTLRKTILTEVQIRCTSNTDPLCLSHPGALLLCACVLAPSRGLSLHCHVALSRGLSSSLCDSFMQITPCCFDGILIQCGGHSSKLLGFVRHCKQSAILDSSRRGISSDGGLGSNNDEGYSQVR